MRSPSELVGHLPFVARELRRDPGLWHAYRIATRRAWRDGRVGEPAPRFAVFVGHGFSGHSLVGSLLNAHPDVVISHELDVLRFLSHGFGRSQLLGLVRYRDALWAEQGRVQNSYSYLVPGQHQGQVRELRVIGDKKGGVTTMRLADDPALLDRLRTEMRMPLRVINVTRTPLDNIGSMVRTLQLDLRDAVAIWRRQVETVGWLQTQLDPAEYLCLRSEDVKERPVDGLRELCLFVGVDPHPEYLRVCAEVVDPRPAPSRVVVPVWPADVLREVGDVVSQHAHLHCYLSDLDAETSTAVDV